MKKITKFFGIIALAAIIIFSAAACDNGNKPSKPTVQTPAATDFIISGLSRVYDGVEKTVSITPASGKSTGALTIRYEGADGTTYPVSTAAPINAGAYNVTFDVAAASGWKAASGLSAGKLTVSKAAPTADDYNFSGLNQVYDGDELPVTITPKPGKSPGERTVWYEGIEGSQYPISTTPPKAAGVYAVTFDVAADANWEEANGLAAGKLTVELPESDALRITFTEFGDEEIDYADDIDTYVSLGDYFTVVVEGEYDYYMWYFNGSYWDEGIDSAVIDPWSYGYMPGIFYITIIVEKNGVPYSKELAIRVEL